MSIENTPEMNAQEREKWFSEELYCHEDALRTWLSRKFKLNHHLDDVIQEAYVQVMKATSVKIVKNPKAYLYSTAKFIAIAIIKKESRHAYLAFDDDSVIVPFDNTKSSYQNITEKDDLQLLREAIKKLPKKCRNIFIMQRIKGMSYAEIAEDLGISTHTVSAQLSIGLNKCAHYINSRKYK